LASAIIVLPAALRDALARRLRHDARRLDEAVHVGARVGLEHRLDRAEGVEDGQNAWNYLRELAASHTEATIRQAVACVITDIEMPEMDGFNLTRQIRAHPVLKDLPVVLFSSLVSKDNEKKGRQVGATAQISKPKWSELTVALTEVLDQVLNAPAAQG
jgi:CheY-like chemotaxis protein